MPGDKAITPPSQLPCFEPTVATHPTDPSKIVVGCNRDGSSIVIFYSGDGGKTWAQTVLPQQGADRLQSDPCLAWNSDGRVYALAVGVAGPKDTPNTRIYAFHSDNFGQEWTFEQIISGSELSPDRPGISVDPSSVYKDQVYATWTGKVITQSTTKHYVYFAQRGTNPNDTWTAPSIVSGAETTGTPDGGDVRASGTGRVYVLWPDFQDVPQPFHDAGPTHLYCANSDGGSSFGTPHLITTLNAVAPPGAPESDVLLIPAAPKRFAEIAIFAEVLSGMPFDTLFAVWTDLANAGQCSSPNGPGTDVNSSCVTRVWFGRSTDSGSTWTTIKMLNDVASRSDQFLPRIARDPSTGALAVAYYDTAEDPNRVAADVVMQLSMDNGDTWSDASVLTGASTNETTQSADDFEYGDYLGLSAQDGAFVCVWTDRRVSSEAERIWFSVVRIVNGALHVSSSLALPIHTPSDWILVSGFGPVDPPPYESGKHDDLVLETSGDGDLFAAMSGKLTVFYPGSLMREADIELPDSDDSDSAVAVSLYLRPNSLAVDDDLRKAAQQFGGIEGFKYANIDLPSLIEALTPLIQTHHNTIGETRTPEQTVVELLNGQRGGLEIRAGTRIGQASTQNASPGARRFAFAVLTDTGPIDPAYVYSALPNSVIDGPGALSNFLAVAPAGNWPPFALDASADDLIDLTSHHLYSMAALETLRPPNHINVDVYTWRKIGNGQKNQWLARLRARAGYPINNEQVPVFDFDDRDSRNVFQLEAVVEFYSNFDDPWAGGAPRNPTDNAYVPVGLLDPAGTNATITATNNVVQLNAVPGSQDAATITALLADTVKYNIVNVGQQYRDVLVLDDDTNGARPAHTYRITDIDPNTQRVTLDSAPTLVGASRWTLQRRPVIVIVDPFGPRAGLRAGQHATTASGTDIVLDGSPSLGRVDPYHDTAYFSGDQAPVSATHPISRTYLIQTVNDGSDHITVDATPSLGTGSPWVIPAGVGGVLDGGSNVLKRSSNNYGVDHYDAALFIVFQGRILTSPWPWSSFTSWESLGSTDGHPGASIRGNRKYVFSSFRSSESFRNWCFRVTDPALPYTTKAPGDSDHVSTSRRYYVALPGNVVTNNTGGMTNIRLHAGTRANAVANPKSDPPVKATYGSGSAGCLVSHEHGHMRAELIRQYKEEHLAAFAAADTRFDTLQLKVTTQDGIAYAGKTQLDEWNSLIVGQLWLIRPDERPLHP